MVTLRELLEMSEITRGKLPLSSFVFPEERAWPIIPKKYARSAIKYMWMGRGDRTKYPTVIQAIRAKYKDDAAIMALLQQHMQAIRAQE